MTQDPQGPQKTVAQRLREQMAAGIRPKHASQALSSFMDKRADGTAMGGLDLGGFEALPAAAGKGIADSLLSFGRGLNWLGYAANKLGLSGPAGAMAAGGFGLPESEIPKQMDLGIPKDLMSALPEETALRLESRLAKAPTFASGAVNTRSMAEFTGHIGTLIPSGGAGAMGAAAKVATTPGRAISVLSAPGVKVGAHLVQNVKNAGFWSRAAKEGIPGAIGGTSGFGLYEFMVAEGGYEERMAALGMGAMTGAGIGLLGAIGRESERRMIAAHLRGDAKTSRQWLKNMRDLQAGRMDLTKMQRAMPTVVNTAIENTGFAGLQPEFWPDLIAGMGGDQRRLIKAASIWFGSFPALLLAKGAHPNAWRRDNPEFNTLRQRVEWYQGVRAADRAQRKVDEAGRPQDPQDRGGGVESRADIEGLDPSFKPGMEGRPKEGEVAETPMGMYADPLLRAGWEGAPDAKYDGGPVDLVFPGSGSIRLEDHVTEEGISSVRVEVDASIFKAVHGEEAKTKTVVMEGPVAEEFVSDLAVMSMIRRIDGELQFGGFGEAAAGGPWKGEGGSYNVIGLDGKRYTKEGALDAEWKVAEKADPPLADNQLAGNSELASWVELAKELRNNTAYNPAMDLLEASLGLVTKGDINSRSVQELFDFLTSPMAEGLTNAQLIAQSLRPENIEGFGHIVGQVASGHLAAQRAREMLGPELAPKPRTPEVEPAAREEPLSEIELREEKFLQEETAERLAAEEGREPGKVDPFEGQEGSVGREVKDQPHRDPKSAVKFSVLNPENYFAPMSKQIARSGPKAAEFAQRAIDTTDLQKANLGKVNVLADKPLDQMRGMRMGFKPETRKAAKQARETKRWSEEISWEGQAGDSNWKLLVENKIKEEFRGQVPEQATQWKSLYGRLRNLTGQMFKTAGTLRVVERNKKQRVELAEPSSADAPIFIRQPSEQFQKIQRNKPKELDEIVEIVAKHGRNNVDPATLKSKWAEEIKRIESHDAFEFSRFLPDMPSHVRLKSGKVVKLLEASPYESTRNLGESGATRSAAIKHLGQDNPFNPNTQKALYNQWERMRKKTGGAPGPTELMNSLEAGTPLGTAAALVKALHGVSADQLPQIIPGWARKTETLTRVMKILPSAVLDLVEGLGTIPQFTGYKDAFYGMVIATNRFVKGKSGESVYAEVRRELEEIGALTIEAGHHLFVEDTGLIGWATQKVGLPKQMAADAGAVMAGISAKRVLKRWDDGKWSWQDVLALERMEFQDAQVESLRQGKAGKDLRNTFIRRFVSNATAQFLRGERSRAGASSAVNLLAPYNRYFMNRFRQLVEVHGQLGKEFRRLKATAKGDAQALKDNRARTAAAASAVLKFHGGSLVAGALGTYMGYIMIDGLFDSSEQIYNELEMDPLDVMTRSWDSSWLGGVPKGLVDLYANKSLPKAERAERVLPGFGSALLELYYSDLATPWWTGSGAYRGQEVSERALTYSQRVFPVLRNLDFLAAWSGFPVDEDMEGAKRALGRWRRITDKQAGRGPDTIEDEDLARYRSMRELRKVILAVAGEGVERVKDDVRVKKALREALKDQGGKGIARSLNGMRVFTRLDADEVADLAEREGEGVLQRLQQHDEALSAIANTYKRVPRDLEALGNDYDMGRLIDVGRKAAQAGNAKGFRAAFNAIEELFDANRTARLPEPREDLHELATVMANFPEVSREMLGEDQRRRLERMKQSQTRKRYLYRILITRLRGDRKRPPTAEQAEEQGNG